MAKKKNTWHNQPKGILVGLALSLFIFGVVIIGVWQYQQRRLENNFRKIDLSVTNLKNNLKNELGDSLITKESYCFLQQYKWEKGTIRCDISLRVEGVTMEKVIKIKKNIQNSTEWNEQKAPNLDQFPYSDGIYKNKNTKIDCFFGVSQSKELFDVSFSCSELSKRAFYPYKN